MCLDILNLLEKQVKSKVLKYVVSFSIITLIAINVVTDWLYYEDIKSLKNGLVYGVIGSVSTNALLILSILSILFSLIDFISIFRELNRVAKPSILNGSKESFKETIDISHDIITLLSIWLDSLPKAVVNMEIAGCHEYAISWLQIFKASILLICATIKVVVVVIRYFYDNAKPDDEGMPKSKNEKITLGIISGIRGGICLGMIFQLVTFGLTYHMTFIENLSGTPQLRKPPGLFGKATPNTEQYFNGVHIFLNYDMLTKPESHITNPSEYWIKLASIQEIIKESSPMKVNVKYFESEGNRTLFYKKVTHSTDVSLCFRKTGDIQFQITDCPDQNSTGMISYDFVFNYTVPNHRQVFGDITYNLVSVNQQHPVTLQNTQVTDLQNKLVYFSTQEVAFNYTLPLILNAQTQAGVNSQAYNIFNTNDLESIYKSWTTGYFKCPSTANQYPTFKESVNP